MEQDVTIKDVARRAKVGIATVSRVLNDSRRVDPETRARVREAMRKMGYRPNATGRRLVKRTTEMMCFVLSNRDFMNPFHSGVLYGVERCLSTEHLDVVFTNLHYDGSAAPDQLVLPRIFTHRGIADGFIVSGTNYPNLLAALDELRVPYVLFGNNLMDGGPPTRRDTVYYDDAAIGRQMVERLVGFGHRHIWFAGDTQMPWFAQRASHYREAMQAQRLDAHAFSESSSGKTYVEYGELAMAKILESGKPVTALVAGNDGIAYGAWRVMRRAGLTVPGDISLVGFDDVPEASWIEPPITTVRVSTGEIGAACARLLLEKLKAGGAPQPPVYVASELVERGSWGPAPVQSNRRSA